MSQIKKTLLIIGGSMQRFSFVLFSLFFFFCFESVSIIAQDSQQSNKLSQIIKKQQKRYVKESCGTLDYQCFTEKDLERFKGNRTTTVVTNSLQQDISFWRVILWLKNLPTERKENMFEQAKETYKPTWAELGEVSCKGQTQAGQEAERMIADAVEKLARDLEKRPEQDILKHTK